MTSQQQDAPPAVSQREIQEILRTFARSGWSSMHLDIGGMRITVGKNGPPAAPPTGAAAMRAEPSLPAAEPAEPAAPTPTPTPTPAPAPTPAPPSASGVEAAGLIEVRSPAVGTFWVAPDPGSPPFVQTGQRVEAEEQLAIVEVMKLMNPVLAAQGGEVAQVCAANGEMVEYDQVLFLLRPTADA
jgi:acetyl-CoA carboxylase biotin carboxyl carrier protein